MDVEGLETVHKMSGRLQRVMTVTVLAFFPQSTVSFLSFSHFLISSSPILSAVETHAHWGQVGSTESRLSVHILI